MKKILFGILIGASAGVGAMLLFPRSHNQIKPASEVAAPASPEKEHPLHFPPAKRNTAGITLEKPTEFSLAAETPAFGQVIDPTPLVSLVAEVASTHATTVASEKEYARVKRLFDAAGNVSAQVVDTAEASAARDRVAATSARMRLMATWGRNLAGNLEVVGKAIEEGATLVRLDVLPGEIVSTAPKKAHVSLIGGGEIFEAEVIGFAATADPQVQGASFTALVKGRSLPVGAALRATISDAGEPVKVLVVPRDAIVYHQGSAWAFVLEEEDTFERKLVSLGRSAPNNRVVIIQGLTADEQVVITGAQQLLAVELQAGGAPVEE